MDGITKLYFFKDPTRVCIGSSWRSKLQPTTRGALVRWLRLILVGGSLRCAFSRIGRRVGAARSLFFLLIYSLRRGVKSAAPLYASAAQKDLEIEAALLAAGQREVSGRLRRLECAPQCSSRVFALTVGFTPAFPCIARVVRRSTRAGYGLFGARQD